MPRPIAWSINASSSAAALPQQQRLPAHRRLQQQQPLRAALNRTRLPGVCAPTAENDGGDCSSGDSGSWSTLKHQIKSMGGCVAKCNACARCAFVSLSLLRPHQECSWYAACNLDDLRPPMATGRDYVTVHVKYAAEPERLAVPDYVPPARQMRVAIVTLRVGGAKHAACGMPQWCHEARRYASVISSLPGFNATVIVIGRRRSRPSDAEATSGFDERDCEGATIVESDEQVEAAMRACGAHPRHGHATLASTHPSLLKWGPVGWTHFDWVVFADSDVMLMPVETEVRDVAAMWARMAGGGAGGAAPGVRFVSSGDHSAPVNAGLWILRPSESDFREGLSVLRRCRFNGTHGWELAGPPRTLGLRPIFADGASVCGGARGGTCLDVGRKADLGDDPVGNDAYKRNTYGNGAFVGSDIDQGFFWYVYYVRLQAGAYFRYHSNKHKAEHWYGMGKPWEVVRGGVAAVRNAEVSLLSYSYSWLIRATALRPGAGGECTAYGTRLRHAIESDPRFPTLAFQNAPFFPIW